MGQGYILVLLAVNGHGRGFRSDFSGTIARIVDTKGWKPRLLQLPNILYNVCMTRGILITGNESALSRALEAETTKRVQRYVSAFIPNRIASTSMSKREPSTEETEESRLSLDWNPGSPISARTLVLAAENRLERIDEAILVCSPPSICRSASQLPLADVEVLINDHIKGWFFLIKELTTVFTNRKNGTLALVYHDNISKAAQDGSVDLLGPSATASFGAFTRSLLAASRSEPYITMGFSGSTGDEAGFAAFVFKNLDEGNRRKNGKLQKYGKFDISNLFGSLKKKA